ncbi:hypothetical protein ACH49_16685 [Streptomyces leeuwenhoekii]|uniref:ESX-1 secretion-associated protein n=1 Tax=Streptomyces leeuwenhoekii TaxID=1437453 RepID=A0ABR5HXE9_STRLW|nr:hypothetical protein [Streptomyces leeuwenhoekii]KMS78318.1 hypothetical protein ACH49_16685 [Streptomyces leeuwenhoekii]
MTTPTTGYEPEPSDVAAEVASHLDDITDPLERYHRATAAQAHHQAVVAGLQQERDKALAQLNADGASYEKLTVLAPGMTRSGIQKAVERGRRLSRDAG